MDNKTLEKVIKEETLLKDLEWAYSEVKKLNKMPKKTRNPKKIALEELLGNQPQKTNTPTQEM